MFYLTGLGLSESQTGLLLALTLVGDTVISLYLTTAADRIGRRRMLVLGSLLMASAGLAFASTRNFLFLVIAGTIGVVSPSGNEVGPFLSIEQAALAHVIPGRSRTAAFAWYTLTGSFGTALGALCGGMIPAVAKGRIEALGGYRAVVILYAGLGLLLALLFARVSRGVEVNALKAGGGLRLKPQRLGLDHAGDRPHPGEQRVDLGLRVRRRERLVAAVAPVRVAADVRDLDADRTRVVAVGVLGDALVRDETLDRAVEVDVVVAAVAGLRLFVADALAELARHRHVRQFGTVDHDQIDVGERAPIDVEARVVGLRLEDEERRVGRDEDEERRRVGGEGPTASTRFVAQLLVNVL